MTVVLSGPDLDVAAVVAALDQASPWVGIDLGPMGEEDWVPAGELGADALLVDAAARLEPRTGGASGIGATFLTGYAASALLLPIIGGAVLSGWQPTPTAGQIALAWHPGGHWFDRVRLTSAVRWVGPQRGGSRLDPAGVADTTQALLSPLIDGLVARRAHGRRALWNTVADEVTRLALGSVEAAGGDAEEGMQLAARLCAALPEVTTQPNFLAVWRGPHEEILTLRQQCCLAYKAPDADGFCLTCPLLDEVTRAARCDQMG